LGLECLQYSIVARTIILPRKQSDTAQHQLIFDFVECWL
jgi:hypothetical protein